MSQFSKSFRKYLAVFELTWQQGLVYRLNFTLWRVRSLLQLLLVYFIWWTVFQTSNSVFGYTEKSIITYILASAVIRAIILSSRVMDIGGQINEGNIVNFLLKPLDFIKYYFARDIADKLMNISFVLVEVLLIVTFLGSQVTIQLNPIILLLFILAVMLGLVLYFSLAFTLGLLAFWLENIWGTYFLLAMFIESLGGGIFPIDVLPKSVANLILLTPFPYLIYFPAKIYIGGLGNDQILRGFVILIFWVIILWIIMKKTLSAGLKTYTAVGH
jgi:ABC-2 type transport system permease protein